MGESDDYVDKAEEERLGILAKYDKGREEGVQYGEWEDPAFVVYHATDHYGFVQKTRLPEKIGGHELKGRDLEVKRSDKWIKMYRAWPKYKNSDKFIKRTYKGIPNKVRGLFWTLMLDLPNIKKEQEGKYAEMYKLARLHSPDIRQIDLDVNRTYRDHVIFRERYSVKQCSLFNILAAYSIYNSEVGYCQGMSQIAALLLMYMDEEDAFWGLAQLMTGPKFGMHGFFVHGFPKLIRFQAHHDKILQSLLPKLKKHLDKYEVDSGIYTLKWFFQCFLDRVPFELALRLWDVFLLDGDKVLTCGAFTILKVHFKSLVSRKSMDDILSFFQTELPVKGMDNDRVIESYQKCMDDLRRKKLDRAGEPSDEEFPKKPFGVIEHVQKQVPEKREAPEERMKREMEAKRLQRAQLATDETDEFDNEEDEMEETSMMDKASASRISLAATSIASSSIADSPRNVQRPLSSISNMYYTSAVQESPSTLERSNNTPHKMNGVNHVKTNKSATDNKLSPTSESTDESHDTVRPLSAKESFFQSVNNANMNTSSAHITTFHSMPRAASNSYKDEQRRISEKLATNNGSGDATDFDSAASDKRHTNSLGRKPVKPIRNSKSPSPPAPPPRSLQQSTINSTTFISHEQTICSTASVTSSTFEHYSQTDIRDSSRSGYHNSLTRKKGPPPVSPRRSMVANSTSPQSSSGRSYTSMDSSVSSVNIPGGEAVRIHVPYVNDASISNASSTAYHHHHSSTSITGNNSSSMSTRNGLDIRKNDPNRIKIEVSSSASPQ